MRCAKNRNLRPDPQRGAALIVAMVVLFALLLLGLTVADGVAIETQAAGAERSGEMALYIAEAGIAWGIQHLSHELLPTYGIKPSDPNPDYPGVLFPNLDPIIAGDPKCPDATCPIFGWYQLHPDKIAEGFGRGSYRVVVSSGPNGEKDILRIRSLGKAPAGGQRLIEVTVGGAD